MIFRSPYPEVSIPSTPLTPFVLRKAERLGDKAAIIDGASGQAISYGQLNDRIRRAAAGLARLGFRKGDVLAIYSPNVPEYAIAFHAVSLVGGIITTLNPLSTPEEAAGQLRDSSAKWVVTHPAVLNKAQEAARNSGISRVFAFGDEEGVTAFASLEEEGLVPEVDIQPYEDVVALPYSSGTTGLPKGVMLTHRNLAANLIQMEATYLGSEEDVLIGLLPFFHIYGLNVVMNASIYHGSTVVTMPRFDLEQFLTILESYKVTMAHLVPPLILTLAKHPMVARFKLEELRTIFSGAAPLGAELSEECSKRLNCQIIQGYGMTETSPATHFTPNDPLKRKPGSVGVLAPNTECRIVDVEDGKELSHEEAGELWVRGPQVMKGYLNQPEATSQTIDADAWLHTGDVGYADVDHQFYIVDRIKEMIKYKGFQIAPAELEAALISHASIADAAVVPYPDPEAGEVPKAFVVLKTSISPAEIMDYIAARVASYKRIRLVEIVDHIPKSSSGKILRRLLTSKPEPGEG